MKTGIIKLGKLNNFIVLKDKFEYKFLSLKNHLLFSVPCTKMYSLLFLNNSIFIKNYEMQNNNFLKKIQFFKNLIKGFSSGYFCHLIIQGVGYRFINNKNNTLSVKAGYSNLININIPESVDILFLSNTEIIVKSFNYDLLKLFCLNLKRVRVPDSYKGKGVRFFDDIISLKNIKKNV